VIRRTLAPELRAAARAYPVVTVTGPRQSGKTTLCRATFPKKPYVSLESLDNREFAEQDPRGFLAEYARGAVVDEVQQVPGLLSYLQEDVDERPVYGGEAKRTQGGMTPLVADRNRAVGGRATQASRRRAPARKDVGAESQEPRQRRRATPGLMTGPITLAPHRWASSHHEHADGRTLRCA
jgi:hypothetical protein